MEKLSLLVHANAYYIPEKPVKFPRRIPRFSCRIDNKRWKKFKPISAVLTNPDSTHTAATQTYMVNGAAEVKDDNKTRNVMGKEERVKGEEMKGKRLYANTVYPVRTVKSSKSRRLSLRTRIALKRLALENLVNDSADDGIKDGLWSREADELVNSSFDLKALNWKNLHHGYLSPQEEARLLEYVRPIKHLQSLRKELTKVLGREPSDDEWASAANMEFKTLRRQLELGQAAKNKLVEYNCRLVLHFARKYERDAGSFTLEDICQEGVKGLMDAVDHFKPKQGARFSTYAIYWIRTAIIRAIIRTGSLVRLPYSFAMKRLEMRRAIGELCKELGRYPTDEEIMQRVGLDPVQYWNVRNFRVRSLNETLGNTNEELIDYLPENGDIISDSPEIQEALQTVLEKLRPKERMVLEQRYGLEDGKIEVQSLRDVGRKLKMSQEMVRKYEAKALEQLRQDKDLDQLRMSMDSNQITSFDVRV